MSPLQALRELDLLTWSTIQFGLGRGWTTPRDAVEHAFVLLSDGCDDQTVALVAGGEFLDGDEFTSLVSDLANPLDEQEAEDKWRLAHLLCIAKSDANDQRRIDELQKVYAAFDYPDDMAACSIYSQDLVDPLRAMNGVIEQLRKTLIHK